MKHLHTIILLAFLCMAGASCSRTADIAPTVLDVRQICDMAVLECYYHNNAQVLRKDKQQQWIDYGSTVKIGIDASLVNIAIDGDTVTVTLPKAKVLGEPKIDTDSIDILTASGAKITNEEQVRALHEANENAKATTESNTQLLANADSRIRKILESYIQQIGALAGKRYKVVFVSTEATAAKAAD